MNEFISDILNLNDKLKGVCGDIQKTIIEIEHFVASLPISLRQKNEWRAKILCFHDRYGSGQILSSYKKYKLDIECDTKKLFALINLSKLWTTKIRHKLAQRTDAERIQMQRPLHGSSLLTLIVPNNPKYSAGLNALLVTAFHPVVGVKSIRHDNEQHNKVPYRIPKEIQPNIPNILKIKEVSAIKINSLIQDIYLAREGKKPIKFNDCIEFVEKLSLIDIDIWDMFGLLPPKYNVDCEFKCIVPDVTPGKQIIIWKTWHTTTGNQNTSNITAFVDYVPQSHFTPGEALWYKYSAAVAPTDPGAGSSRGTWHMLESAVKNKFELGLPSEIIRKWSILPSTPLLSSEAIQEFNQKGYLIIDIPKEIQQIYPADASLNNFNEFFRTIANDAMFDCKKVESMLKSEKLSEAEKNGDRFKYFVNKIDINHPFDVNATAGKVQFALKGGKLIAAESGMGPGSTLTNDPIHLGFEFSEFVKSIMSSFYLNQPMYCVLERFRLKTRNQWKSGYHVDIKGETIIPKNMQKHIFGLTHFSSEF